MTVISPNLRIVIPGGSGQVGTLLARHFHAQGHFVTVLSRHPVTKPWRIVPWDATTLGPWAKELDGADVVINLTGRNVNCRYSDRNRREILESRVFSTKVIGEAIPQLANPPNLWLNASTATIYRHAWDRPMDEATGEIGGREPDAPASWAFSIEVATRWEEAFFAAKTPNTRKVALRSAATMSPDRGGIFDILLTLVRFGLGGRVASGKQYVSWIHDADFIRAVEYFIAHTEFDGIVNVASPNPLPQSQFMQLLREAWGTRIGLPAEKWMLEIGVIFLRTETELVLKSRRVIPGRLLEAGFKFEFPDWNSAAKDLVARWRKGSR
jgi:uncharacterized protein (TIGR01777 family)